MLITNDQVDELVSVLADLSGLDEELIQRCGSLIRTQRYDEAVARAFVVLEERLRDLMNLRGGAGRQLVSKLFSENDPRFIEKLNLPEQEWQGIRNIFDGAFAAYRNRAAHTVAGYTLHEARAIIQLVNLLLLVTERIRRAPDQHVPPRVAQRLDATAAERLQGFLANLQDIGVVKEEAITADAYKANLLYGFPSWKEYRQHAVTVFYLSKGTPPALRFRMDMLSLVKDLNTDELETKLLDAGCRRVARKSTPIELVLTERNDQATLDHLFEILRDLMEKHRV